MAYVLNGKSKVLSMKGTICEGGGEVERDKQKMHFIFLAKY